MPSCDTELLEVIEQETLIELQPELVEVELDPPEQTLTDEADPEVLTDTEEAQLVLEQEVPVVLLDSGTQGPPGPPGQGGTAYISLPSANALGGHRVVRLSAGVLVYADSADVSFANAPLGITRGAVSAGGTAEIQTSGLMTEPSWSWTPDQPVFVGANGVPVQPSPATGYSLIVGVATSPTQLFIGAKMPIVLQE